MKPRRTMQTFVSHIAWESEVWIGATMKAAALKALFDVDPSKQHSQEHQAKVEL